METALYDVKVSFKERLARLRAIMSELSIVVPGVSDESILDKTESFIAKIKQIHGDKFDYSKTVYVSGRSYVVLICPDHGEFVKKPHEMYSPKAGCKFCNRAAMGKRSQMTKEVFVERCNKLYNNKFDYSKLVLNQSYLKVTIICPTHGEFSQQAHNHLNGIGCPRCNKTATYSTAGMEWVRFLCVTKKLLHAENGGEFQIVPTRYRADAYDQETNTVYEFHGSLYHGDPRIYSADFVNPVNKKTMGELYERTLARRDEIISHGYKYVEIWESEWVYAVRVVIWIQRVFRRSRGTLGDKLAVRFPKRMTPRFTSSATIPTPPPTPTKPIVEQTAKPTAEPTAKPSAKPTTTQTVTQTAKRPVGRPAKPPELRAAAPTAETHLSNTLWKLIFDYEISYPGMFCWGFLESAKITPEYFHRDLMEIWKELSPDSRKRIKVSDFHEAIMWLNAHYLTDVAAADIETIKKKNMPEWIWRCEKTGFWLALESNEVIKDHIARRLTASGF